MTEVMFSQQLVIESPPYSPRGAGKTVRSVDPGGAFPSVYVYKGEWVTLVCHNRDVYRSVKVERAGYYGHVEDLFEISWSDYGSTRGLERAFVAFMWRDRE